LVNTPSAAAAAAVMTVASQRRPALDCAGPTACSTGPLSRRLTADPSALSWVSQSRTGRRSSYSVLQSSHARRWRRMSADAGWSSAPTIYAPISPRHRAHAWLTAVPRSTHPVRRHTQLTAETPGRPPSAGKPRSAICMPVRSGTLSQLRPDCVLSRALSTPACNTLRQGISFSDRPCESGSPASRSIWWPGCAGTAAKRRG